MAEKDAQPVVEKAADSTDVRKGSIKKGAETSKFSNHGTAFRAKLIGYEDVPEARGDEMCQKALAGLKQAVVAAKEHKQKIAFKMTLENLEIVDLTTSEVLHQHPISKVSFIAKDASDSRAFGYVVGKGDGKFQFFGIKTEKAAEQVVLTLRDLFTEVFNLKKQAREKEAEAAETAVAVSAVEAAAPPAYLAATVQPAAASAAAAPSPPAATTAPPSEPKKSAVASLIDLDIDWGIGSSQPSSQASAAFPNSAWGGATSPLTQMGLGGASPMTQVGLGGSLPMQNDPFVVAPTVARQVGSQPPAQQPQQQLPSSLSSPYPLPGFGVQQQQLQFGQQQQSPFGQQPMASPFGQQQQQPSTFGQQQQQQPSPFGQQQQQPSPFGQQQQQPSPFGQQQQQPSPFGQQQQQPSLYGQQQQQPSPFGQQQTASMAAAYGQQVSPAMAYGQQAAQYGGAAASQQQINAAGQMQWPQLGQNSTAAASTAGAFGLAPAAAAAGSLQLSQQQPSSLFAQGQPAAMAAQAGQPSLPGPFGAIPPQYTQQQQLLQQQQSLFFQQQPGTVGIQQAFGGQQTGGTLVNPFSPSSQQQQQIVNNPFGAASQPGGAAAAQPSMLPRPAPRANQPQQVGSWGGSGPVPVPRGAEDSFADLDLLRNSAGSNTATQAPQAGTGGTNPTGSFW